jgi:GNAT superfamily N-acetyltransferase
VRTVQIRRSTLTSPDATRLIEALNVELTAAFPERGATHFSLTDLQVAEGQGAFLLAYLDDVAVGCGAVRRLDETTAELKRMYVAPSVRGRGVGRALLEGLEREARLLGVTTVVLETGMRLAPAIKLYETTRYIHGFRSLASTFPRRARASVTANRSREGHHTERRSPSISPSRQNRLSLPRSRHRPGPAARQISQRSSIRNYAKHGQFGGSFAQRDS